MENPGCLVSNALNGFKFRVFYKELWYVYYKLIKWTEYPNLDVFIVFVYTFLFQGSFHHNQFTLWALSIITIHETKYFLIMSLRWMQTYSRQRKTKHNENKIEGITPSPKKNYVPKFLTSITKKMGVTISSRTLFPKLPLWLHGFAITPSRAKSSLFSTLDPFNLEFVSAPQRKKSLAKVR